MCRFIQYFIKFIVPAIASRGPQNNDIKDRLEKLGGNMSTTRKVLRFGKPIPLIKAIIDRLVEHQKRPVRMFWLRTLNDIFLTLYFLTDHPLYFQKIGFIKMDKDTVNQIDYINNLFWLFNAVLDIICDLADFMYFQNEIKIIVSDVCLMIVMLFFIFKDIKYEFTIFYSFTSYYRRKMVIQATQI